MAESTKGDTEVNYLCLLAPALIAVIAGLVIHLFIVVVNVNDWWNGRTLSPVDHIVTSLGISRIPIPCAYTLDLFLPSLFMKSLYVEKALVVIDIVYAFFCYLDIWLTSLLSIVYYLTISNLHTGLFLCLRRIIIQRTGYFIAATVLLSTSNCLFPLLVASTKVTKSGLYNATTNNPLNNDTYINYIFNNVIGTFLPVLFYYISSVLLFASMYKHTSRMKMSNNLTINLETYYSVMRFVSFTFLYKTIHNLAQSICTFYYYFYDVTLIQLYIALEFLLVLHSSYLIYRTAKYRSQMSKVLQTVIDLFIPKESYRT